jgi:hypothetical protein
MSVPFVVLFVVALAYAIAANPAIIARITETETTMILVFLSSSHHPLIFTRSDLD